MSALTLAQIAVWLGSRPRDRWTRVLDIADRFEVSRPTAFRYIQLLQDAGFSIERCDRACNGDVRGPHRGVRAKYRIEAVD